MNTLSVKPLAAYAVTSPGAERHPVIVTIWPGVVGGIVECTKCPGGECEHTMMIAGMMSKGELPLPSIAISATFHLPAYQGVLAEIGVERERQDEQWDGAAHDDTHTASDWIFYMMKFLGRACTYPLDLRVYRSNLIKVAALAVAAIEWTDRRFRASGRDVRI